MSSTATGVVVILYLVALGILAAVGLWPVVAAVLAVIVAVTLFNQLTVQKVREATGSQAPIIEKVIEQLSHFNEELASMRADMNRGLWTMHSRKEEKKEDEHFLALANKVIDIENKLNKIRDIVEREEA